MNIVGNENDIPGMNGPNQPQMPNIGLKDAEDVKCEKCESQIFEEKMMIKKVSKFATGSSRDSIAPIPVIVCAKCNHINEMFIPKI